MNKKYSQDGRYGTKNARNIPSEKVLKNNSKSKIKWLLNNINARSNINYLCGHII